MPPGDFGQSGDAPGAGNPSSLERYAGLAGSPRTVANKRAFLENYRKCGIISAAAEAVGINRKTHNKWLEADPVYAEAFADAQEDAADSLEATAMHRAVQGWDEPVFHKGEVVGTIHRWDHTLLIFLLNGMRPWKYKVRHEHTGAAGGPIRHAHLHAGAAIDLEVEVTFDERPRPPGRGSMPGVEGEAAPALPAATGDGKGEQT